MKTKHFLPLLSLALFGMSDLSLGITPDATKTNQHLLPPRHDKSLTIPSEAEIRLWARSRGVPVLVIDPSQIDTSRFAGWYSPAATIPLGSFSGSHLFVGDIDGNDMEEFYGYYMSPTFPYDALARIYEIDSTFSGSFRYTFGPAPGVIATIEDINSDGLTDCIWLSDYGSIIRGFTQPAADSLPTAHLFDFDLEAPFSVNVSPVFADLDKDGRTECIYLTGYIDSSDTVYRRVGAAAIARYDDSLHTLRRFWRQTPKGYGPTSGFPVADFDRDGNPEFGAVAGYDGTVSIFEYLNDSTVVQRFEDDTPFVNLLFMAAGDVDGDSWPELFVTATLDGNWTLVYEATVDNTYRLEMMIHFLAGGVFDEPQFYVADMNNDSKADLVCSAGPWTFVLEEDPASGYRVWHAKREEHVAFVVLDLDHDGRMDLVTSSQYLDSLNHLNLYSTLYLASELTAVEPTFQLSEDFRLSQNYPNPFNPVTTIGYTLADPSFVSLRVYDLLGREVKRLVDEMQRPGSRSAVFDASGLASGIYFYKLQAGAFTAVKRMIVVK